jgi:hypothetical protein
MSRPKSLLSLENWRSIKGTSKTHDSRNGELLVEGVLHG